MPTKPSIFISYRRKTAADLAGRIYDRLKGSYDTFLDVETINGGRFANIIQREIINRDVFIVILTPDTLESEWVVREIKTALEYDKLIVPLMAQGFSFSSPLPEEIKDLSNYDAVRWDHDFADAAFERLVKAVDSSFGVVTPTQKLPRPGTNSGLIVAIITGIVALIVVAIAVLPNLPTFTASPTVTPSPPSTNTALPATDTPEPSNTSTPTIVAQPSTTATIIVQLVATSTEAVLQRTVDAIEQTNAALLAENTQIAQTATARSITLATNTPNAEITGCPGSLPSRISAGQLVRVVKGSVPSTIRHLPQGRSIGSIPNETQFRVISMADCELDFNKHLTWWYVEYDGIAGYVLEADEENYFLEPVD